MKPIQKWILLFLSLFSLHSVLAEAKVYDPYRYLSDATVQQVESINQKGDAQLGVYITDSLEGESIESIANKIAREWQIGFSDTNEGVLLFIAINDRQFRLETSDNIAASKITDSQAKRILDSVRPYMREEQYDKAVQHILTDIETQLYSSDKKSDDELTVEQRAVYFAGMTVILLGLFLFGVLIVYVVYPIVRKLNRIWRSRYNYKGKRKLVPSDDNFVYVPSWTDERWEEFWKNSRMARSQYDYIGEDKLYPHDFYFVENDSWTKSRKEEYVRQVEEELERKEKEEKLKRKPLGMIPKYNPTYNRSRNTSSNINNSLLTTLLGVNLINQVTRSNHSSYSNHSSNNTSSGGGGGWSGGGSSSDW